MLKKKEKEEIQKITKYKARFPKKWGIHISKISMYRVYIVRKCGNNILSLINNNLKNEDNNNYFFRSYNNNNIIKIINNNKL